MENKKILLVDDEPHVIYVLKLLLDKNGYEVITAHNGKDALEKVEDERPGVIVTDIQMPHMTGQEFCTHLLEQFPDPERKVIVMTSRTDANLRSWAEKLDNLQFLEKPLSPRLLLAEIRSFYENGKQEVPA